MGVFQAADHFQPVDAGHGNIHHGDIRCQFFHLLERFPTISGFGHHFQVTALFDDAPQAFTDNAMVIG